MGGSVSSISVLMEASGRGCPPFLLEIKIKTLRNYEYENY
jgi:hypothetical protein